MSKDSWKFWNEKLDILSEESDKKQIELESYGFSQNWIDLLSIKF